MYKINIFKSNHILIALKKEVHVAKLSFLKSMSTE